MSAATTIASLKAHLADLGMPGSLEVVDSLMEKLVTAPSVPPSQWSNSSVPS